MPNPGNLRQSRWACLPIQSPSSVPAYDSDECPAVRVLDLLEIQNEDTTLRFRNVHGINGKMSLWNEPADYARRLHAT
jgi:hypothetical protein